MENKLEALQKDNITSATDQQKRSSATEKMIQELSRMINEGQILPGERFPAERTLATQFGVSRNTVREAIHYYETLGMVKRITGSGNYLIDDSDVLYRAISSRQLIERYNWLEMIETRRILEVGIVQLAAERATREDKITLRKINDAAQQASIGSEQANNGNSYTKLDYQLHLAFARMARNSILMEMFEAIRDTFIAAETVWKMSAHDIEIANDAHQKIINAIIKNDSVEAAKEMQKHLDNMTDMVFAAQKNSINRFNKTI